MIVTVRLNWTQAAVIDFTLESDQSATTAGEQCILGAITHEDMRHDRYNTPCTATRWHRDLGLSRNRIKKSCAE